MKSIPKIKFSWSFGNTWNIGDDIFPSISMGILYIPTDDIFPPLADVKCLLVVLILMSLTFCCCNV